MRCFGAVSVGLVAAVLIASCGPQRGTIGAILGRRSDDRVVIRDVPKGLAADRAGLRAGDQILLVEGRDVRSLPDDELHRVLSGLVEQSVRLTVVRGDEVFRVTLERTAPPPRRAHPPADASSKSPPSAP